MGNYRFCTFLVCFILAYPAACASPIAGQDVRTGLDVNDVSVLFPLPTSVEARELLLGGDSKLDDGSDLWPEPVFMSLLQVAAEQRLELSAGAASIVFPPATRQRAAWRIVSFRFDPSAVLEEGGPGIAQIRLVAQPIVAPGPLQGTIDADFAAHLIYLFPEPDGAARLAGELLAIKPEATTGRPLGVHPEVAKQGLDGEQAKSLMAFLRRNLSGARLRLVAVMGLAPAPEPWVFVAGSVGEGGQVTAAPQKFGPNLHTAQALDFRGGGTAEPRFPGISTADLVSNRTTELDPAGATTIATVGNPSLSKLLPRTQDSSIHRDCVSCHSATSALVRLTEKGSRREALERFLDDPQRFRTPPGVTGFADPAALRDFTIIAHGLPWSVRNLGYFEGNPAITMRTVNETAEVAKQANAILQVRDPFTRTCDERAVWACTLSFGEACVETHCKEVAE